MISGNELRHMYCDRKMSQSEIADEVSISCVYVKSLMKKHGIETRIGRGFKSVGVNMPSEDEMRQMYWDRGMSQSEIADEIGVSQGTVRDRMQKYGIRARVGSEFKLIGICMPSEDELRQMYWDRGMSQSEIADEIGVSSNTVHVLMKRYGIKSRTLSESMVGKNAGKNSGNWKGGISFEPYCKRFNNRFKEAVRERDDYTCQLCGHEQLSGGQKLDVHHVHYDKENCYPDVVTLCRSCNTKVNTNRDYWEQYFEDQLVIRGLCNWSI